MPSNPTTLGSHAVYFPSLSTRSVEVDVSTCRNLTLFKELMREYRKIDDGITVRLNRTVAMFREREKLGAGSFTSSPEQDGCAFFWRDLVENWKRRTEIIDYCIQVVDESIGTHLRSIERDSLSVEEEREKKKASFSEEVKRNQIHNELAVEAIIRQRSLDAFRSRCKYFEPPLTDIEARKWWERASRGR